MRNELHEVLRLRPGEHPIKPLAPNEMRKALFRASHYSTLLRRAFEMADYEGFSGEDRFVAATFYLQLEIERNDHSRLRRAMYEANPMVVLNNPSLDKDTKAHAQGLQVPAFAFPDKPCGPVKDAKFE